MLLLKVSGAEERSAAFAEFQRAASAAVEEAAGRVVFLPGQMTDLEVKNLLWCCDCFVSLHRSEGFGRLLAEAMLLGKPVVATGWSGNVDFMTPETACLVPCRMVPVGPGEYPFGDGQSWAEPDVDAAVEHLLRLVDDREYARELGARARRHLRRRLSPRAVGLQYLDRLTAIGELALGQRAGPAVGGSAGPSGIPRQRQERAQ